MDARKTVAHNGSNFDQYLLVYYYATQITAGADVFPTNYHELLICIFLLLFGAIIIGFVIAQFSELLENHTRRQRFKTEEIDAIQSVMFHLRISEKTQRKVLEYYDMIMDSPFDHNEKAFQSLNHSIRELIVLFQANESIKKLSFIHKNNLEIVTLLSHNMKIESFQAGDIIIKQNNQSYKFYFIMVGLVEVILEEKDYEFYAQEEVERQFENLKRADGTQKREQVYMCNQPNERQESNAENGSCSGRMQTQTPVNYFIIL